MSWLEGCAVFFGLVSVYLSTRENIWSWPTAIVNVGLYALLFRREKLYADMGLQVIYLVLSVYGWYEWLHGGAHKTELTITKATPRMWAVLMSIGAVITLILLWLLRLTAHDASLPIADAVTTAFSLVGQYMLNMKIVENWLMWALVDIIYVVMFIDQKLYPTAILYAFFVFLCVKGLLDWHRSARASV